jgi:hypothetical protein
MLSCNPNAIPLTKLIGMNYLPIQIQMPFACLTANPKSEKISWPHLSRNPNAIHLLKRNWDKIDWIQLSFNPNAIHLLRQNQGEIHWSWLSDNPAIFTYDYKMIKEERKKKSYKP